MFISKLKIRKHPILGDIDFDFTDFEGKPYPVIVFVGENACGKTTVLNEIFNYDKSIYIIEKESNNNPDSDGIPYNALFIRQDSKYSSMSNELFSAITGKKDVFPTQNSLNDNTFLRDLRGANSKTVAESFAGAFGSELIAEAVKTNAIDSVTCSGEILTAINGKKSSINLNQLSSGEQEILLKVKQIREKEIMTDFVLLDEPEVSLHPRWQRIIVDEIRKLVQPNKKIDEVFDSQLFIATHSEKVLESVLKKDDVLIIRLFKQDGHIKIEPIYELDLCLPNPSFAELDYVVFHIPSMEYHDQLFTHFGAFFDKDTSTGIDLEIEKKAMKLYGEGNIEKFKKEKMNSRFNRVYFTKMLPTYIRDYFHHPKDIEKPSEDKLVVSIELMRSLIKYMNKKGIKELEDNN